MLRTETVTFHPVIHLPDEYEIYDFTRGYDPDRELSHAYGIGKYDEVRPGMYEGEQFEGIRNIHMGIDIGCPAGEPVLAFYEGTIHCWATTRCPRLRPDHHHAARMAGRWLPAGHLSRESLSRWSEGRTQPAPSSRPSASPTRTVAGTPTCTSSSR